MQMSFRIVQGAWSDGPCILWRDTLCFGRRVRWQPALWNCKIKGSDVQAIHAALEGACRGQIAPVRCCVGRPAAGACCQPSVVRALLGVPEAATGCILDIPQLTRAGVQHGFGRRRGKTWALMHSKCVEIAHANGSDLHDMLSFACIVGLQYFHDFSNTHARRGSCWE